MWRVRMEDIRVLAVQEAPEAPDGQKVPLPATLQGKDAKAGALRPLGQLREGWGQENRGMVPGGQVAHQAKGLDFPAPKPSLRIYMKGFQG